MKNKTVNAAGKKTTSKKKPTRKTATKAQSGVSANPETRISATIDIGWSMGEDYTAHTGQDNNTSPKF